MKSIKHSVAVVLLLMVAPSAFAVHIPLFNTTDLSNDPNIAGAGLVAYTGGPVGASLGINGFNTELTNGTTSPFSGDLLIGIFNVTDLGSGAVFEVSSDSNFPSPTVALSGVITDVFIGTDTIQLLADVSGGDLFALYGSRVAINVTDIVDFLGAPAAIDRASPFDGDGTYDITTLQPASVPAPAPLGLLAMALADMLLRRRAYRGFVAQ